MPLAAIVAPTLLLAACGGGAPAPRGDPSVASGGASPTVAATNTPGKDAAIAAIRQTTASVKRNFSAEYDELHPAQQAVVTRAQFITCAMAAKPVTLDSARALQSAPEAISLTGVPEQTSIVVTVELRKADGTTQQRNVREVLVDGTWRWVLTDAAVKALAAGTCP